MKAFLQHVDALLISVVFQPVVDRFSLFCSAWSLAMSCLLGAMVFQAVSVLMPVILFGASFEQGLQASFVLLINIVFFMGLRRFEPLVRPGMANPLKEMLWGLRIIGLFFLFYQVWTLFQVPRVMLLWFELSGISQFVFVIGLYFMACQPRPPSFQKKVRKHDKALAPSLSSSGS